MKKIIKAIILIIYILFAGIIISNAEDTGSSKLTCTSSEISAGTEFTVTLDVNTDCEISGAESILNYTDNVVLTKVKSGEYGSDLSDKEDLVSGREIEILGDGINKIQNIFVFKAKEDIESDSTIKIWTDNIKVTKTDLSEITITGATITLSVKDKVIEDKPGGEVNNELLSIEIIEQPNKTTYIEGEEFDPTGIKLIAKYEDGREEEITDYTINPSGKLSLNDKKIEIIYEENGMVKKSYLEITVNEKETTTSEQTPGQKDDSNSSNILPSAGKESFIILIVLIIIIGIFNYIKVKEYRKIK